MMSVTSAPLALGELESWSHGTASMDLPAEVTESSDDQLVLLAAEGNDEAFAALYQRYFDNLYDFCVRMLKSPDVASDAVQNCFVKAWQSLRRGDRPQNVRAWLYAIARNDAIDQLRTSKRTVAMSDTETETEDGAYSAFSQIADDRTPGPEAALQNREIAGLVWAAAAALEPKEYALLDMHLRQGLTSDEIAEALQIKKGNAYTMLSRLRDTLEESVTALLLFRRGRKDCHDLDLLMAREGGDRLTPERRKAVRSHLRRCPICQESRRRYVTAAEIFSGFAPVPALPGTRDRIWEQIAGGQTAPAFAPPPTQSNDGSSLVTGVRTLLHDNVRPLVGAIAVVAGLIAILMLRPTTPLPHFDDPSDIRSDSHVVGEVTDRNEISIVWSGQEGIGGYSVSWSHGASALPDAEADLPGTATSARSQPLTSAGDWFFNLRTQSADGRWTSTVHLGPYRIRAGQNGDALRAIMTATPAETAPAPPDATPTPATTSTAGPTTPPSATPGPRVPATLTPAPLPSSGGVTEQADSNTTPPPPSESGNVDPPPAPTTPTPPSPPTTPTVTATPAAATATPSPPPPTITPTVAPTTVITPTPAVPTQPPAATVTPTRTAPIEPTPTRTAVPPVTATPTRTPATGGLLVAPTATTCRNDLDCDGFSDLIEQRYGSDPKDPSSTPESKQYDQSSGRHTCSDGIDNDDDGRIDTVDTGCR